MSPSIQEVKKKYAANLLAMPGVVSVGIGRTADGQNAIIVGLDRWRPKTIRKLPKRLEGYPVRVDIIGRVKAE